MANPQEESIIEKRRESMVSPNGGNPTQRIAHFLKPSETSIDGPVFELPPGFLSPQTTSPEPTKSTLKVFFHGWRQPSKEWKDWVDHMLSLHKTTWNRAGILEAILNSTFDTVRNDDLIYGFAERWCSETKTFVFPWGEATITLEDMMVLGGYSVLGDSVSKSLEDTEMVEIEEKLLEARLEVTRTTDKKASQHTWMNKFMNSGSEIEHEAFLALWLSRFVFPTPAFNTIAKHAFPIAIHLARCTNIALAPTLLASIYRDLRLLKESILVSNNFRTKGYDGGKSTNLTLTVWAPLHLLQIWIWERFPKLGPKPNSTDNADPRMARWDRVKRLNIENLRFAIDSSGEDFLWRPYDPCLDVDLESFARCLRVSELVGLDCIEQYFPHRVAMQFGMDQDLPGRVGSNPNTTPEMAWNNYNRPVGDEELFIPPRQSKSNVTARYFKWWKKSMLSPQDEVNSVVKEENESSYGSLKRKLPICEMGDDDALVPPGFPPKLRRMEPMDSDDEDGLSLTELVRKIRTNDGKIQNMTQLKSVIKSESRIEKINVIEPSDPDEEDVNESGEGHFIGVEKIVKSKPVTELAEKYTEDVNGSGKRTFIREEKIVERDTGAELLETNAEYENESGKENFMQVEGIVKREIVTELPETDVEDAIESGKRKFLWEEKIVEKEIGIELSEETNAGFANKSGAGTPIEMEKDEERETAKELCETNSKNQGTPEISAGWELEERISELEKWFTQLKSRRRFAQN